MRREAVATGNYGLGMSSDFNLCPVEPRSARILKGSAYADTLEGV